MLPVLGSSTGAGFGAHLVVAEGIKDSEEGQGPKEPETLSIIVTVEQCLQLTVNESNRRVHSLRHPLLPANNLLLWYP